MKSPEEKREAIRLASQQYRQRHPERMAGFRKRWAAKRYQKVKAAGICAHCQRVPAPSHSVVCQDCQDQTLWDARLRKYGISREDFLILFEKQHGLCPLCMMPLAHRDAHVDHDHETKRVRGLLCGHCNRGIGCFMDNAESLKRAIAYLERER